jgi:hypothetical protein
VEQNETVLFGAETTKQKTTTHKPRWGKKLPKYDSQSDNNDRQLPLIENHTRPKHKEIENIEIKKLECPS